MLQSTGFKLKHGAKQTQSSRYNNSNNNNSNTAKLTIQKSQEMVLSFGRMLFMELKRGV